jgi:hypothetical protein
LLLCSCQTKQDKNTVLKEMIFPNCEKLGQTIIFTQTRANAKNLHEIMTSIGFTCTSIEVGAVLDLQAGQGGLAGQTNSLGTLSRHVGRCN